MNGFLLLLATMLTQAETLPAPAFGSSMPNTLPAPKTFTVPATPRGFTVAAQIEQPLPIVDAMATKCKVGWNIDPTDQSMFLIVQIAPDAIQAFALGENGQFLELLIPPYLNGRISKIHVQFGTADVPKYPSEEELRSTSASLPTGPSALSGPRIATLDSRVPVNIDGPPRTSDVVPTSGSGNQNVGNPVLPPSTQPPSTSPFLTTPRDGLMTGDVLPSTSGNGVGGNGYNNGIGNGLGNGLTSNGTNWNNNASTRNPNSSLANDNFVPASRNVPPALNLFNNRNNPSAAGNVPGYNNYSNSNVPLIASNPNAMNGNNPGYGVDPMSQPNMANPIYPPGQPNTPMTNPGMPNPSMQGPPTGYIPPPQPQPQLYAQPPYGMFASTQPQPPLPVPVNTPYLASGPKPLPSTSGSYETLANENARLRLEQQNQPPMKQSVLLPFVLLISFIGNVYLGLWLNHLRTRYRSLLGNVRGIAPSELA